MTSRYPGRPKPRPFPRAFPGYRTFVAALVAVASAALVGGAAAIEIGSAAPANLPANPSATNQPGANPSIVNPPDANPPGTGPSTAEWRPEIVAAGQPARTAVVLNSESDDLSIIDGPSLAVTKTVLAGREPHHWMLGPDGRLMIANTRGNDLLYIDRTSGDVQGRRGGIVNPYLSGFSPDDRWMVVNSLRLGFVGIYRGGDLTPIARLKTGGMPSHLAFDADSRKAFVTLQSSDQLVQIDLEKQVVDWSIPVGNTPAGVLLTPDGNHLLVGVMGAADVAVVDWRNARIVKRIPTGRGSHNLLQVPGKPFILVSNRGGNTISVIDLRSFAVIDTLEVPGGPDCMAFSPDNRQLWVTARWRGQVHVLDLADRRIVKTIPVGRSPHGIFVE